MTDEPTVLLELPRTLRDELKEPLGPIHADIRDALPGGDTPLVAVGDVVSYHCERAGRSPDLAVIDGRTKRTDVDPEIASALDDADVARLRASNPPGTLTRSLLDGLRTALDRDEPIQVIVDGEEDLATLPAILAAPAGATVLYGQPDRGVVDVTVDASTRDRARELLESMDGDVEAAIARLRA